MDHKKVLFISGSLGLGHIVRDLAIANELRRQNPAVELSWLASHPGSKFLTEAGEKLEPEADLLANDNVPAEQAAQAGHRLNLLKYLINAVGTWKQNVNAFAQLIGRESFDLVIADEAYEIDIALTDNQVQLNAPFVMMYDFIGNVSLSWNPIDRIGTYMWNREWAKIARAPDRGHRVSLFLGELEDIPDRSLGFLLPRSRDVARAACTFVGYVLQFDPAEYADKEAVRAKLGYGQAPLIICSGGGTAVGADLLLLCGRAYPILRQAVPDLRMLLVCGPRLDPASLDIPEGVEVRGYVDALYEHFAACDLAIVHGGGTSTLELTALRRPFLYFPLEGHFEQQVHVARRLARHQAGIKMSYAQTTPQILADTVLSTLGKEVDYPPIAADGARVAAEIMNGLLQTAR